MLIAAHCGVRDAVFYQVSITLFDPLWTLNAYCSSHNSLAPSSAQGSHPLLLTTSTSLSLGSGLGHLVSPMLSSTSSPSRTMGPTSTGSSTSPHLWGDPGSLWDSQQNTTRGDWGSCWNSPVPTPPPDSPYSRGVQFADNGLGSHSGVSSTNLTLPPYQAGSDVPSGMQLHQLFISVPSVGGTNSLIPTGLMLTLPSVSQVWNNLIVFLC